MAYLLKIDVSPQGESSSSLTVGKAFAAAFAAANPEIEIRVKDLAANPVPHLDGEALTAGYIPLENRSESMQAKHMLRLELINEIAFASAIVVTTPMWNWNVPSVLKAYIDQIVMPGQLDPYGCKKLADKKVTVIIAAGGFYGPGSHHPEFDFETPYLKHIFTSLGAEDVQVIRAEYCLAGIAPGMESLIDKKAESLAEAVAAAEARAKETVAV